MKQDSKTELKKTSLYDLTKSHLDIMGKIEAQAIENEGVFDEVLALKLEEDMAMFDDKAIRGAFVALKLKQEAAFIKERKAELDKRAKALESAEKRLKDYIKACMVSTERKKIQSDLLTVSVKNQAVWPEIVDADQIPQFYKTASFSISGPSVHVHDVFDMLEGVLKEFPFDSLTVKESESINKKAIRAAFLEGKPVPGAVMPESSTTLIIK